MGFWSVLCRRHFSHPIFSDIFPAISGEVKGWKNLSNFDLRFNFSKPHPHLNNQSYIVNIYPSVSLYSYYTSLEQAYIYFSVYLHERVWTGNNYEPNII
jgi:hypothetical protein